MLPLVTEYLSQYGLLIIVPTRHPTNRHIDLSAETAVTIHPHTPFNVPVCSKGQS